MRKLLILLVVALSACGTGEDDSRNAAGPDAAAGNAVADAVRTAGLTGLYEGGQAGTPSQLCIVDRGSGDARFGLVVWGANTHSCSGTGSATQEGEVLRLAMAGDESCTIEARIQGGTITLPAEVAPGCAYYCGARASLGGASFKLRGGTPQDAMKAKDLVGEPLCEGMSPAG